jgi:hypothetical protein
MVTEIIPFKEPGAEVEAAFAIALPARNERLG